MSPATLRAAVAMALILSSVCMSVAQSDPPPTSAPASVKPEALRFAEEARANHRLRTAKLELVEHSRSGGVDDVRYRTWKCAGDDVIIVDHGDADGVVQRDAETGKPAQIDYPGPMGFLVQGDQVWWHSEDSPLAKVLPRENRSMFNLWDLRRLGVDPDTPGESIEQRAAANDIALRYSEQPDGELVRAIVKTKDSSVSWWIDPARDWSVVHTETVVLGKVVEDARYTLEKLDGVWFPVRAELYELGADPAAPTQTIEVISAEFNRPEHPQKFSPADVGIEVGTQVSFLGGNSAAQDQGPMWWDGGKLVSGAEYHRRLDAGEIVKGPTVAREHARLRARSAAREQQVPKAAPKPATTQPMTIDPLGDWERYTLAFIARHQLDDGQRERALAILRDCRDLGNTQLTRSRERIQRWEEQQRTVCGMPSQIPGELERLKRERAELTAGLDRIFEDRLKPRLDALLTSQQRKASESQPASGQ